MALDRNPADALKEHVTNTIDEHLNANDAATGDAS